MRKSRSSPSHLVAGVITGGVKKGVVKKALRDGADILELRVDTLRVKNPAALVSEIKKLEACLAGRRPPLIVTVRSRAEGGKSRMSDDKRLEAFKTLLPFADYVDIELKSGAILKEVVRSARRRRCKVIVSYHNFRETPGRRVLEGIAREAANAGGDLVKIAARARTGDDLKTLAGVLLERKNMIVIAMGRTGAASRVFFPMLGSRITYGSTTEATAPGQLSVRAIKSGLSLYGF